MNDSRQNQRIFLGLMPKTLTGAVAFIEQLSGEKLTPEEIEEVRRALFDD